MVLRTVELFDESDESSLYQQLLRLGENVYVNMLANIQRYDKHQLTGEVVQNYQNATSKLLSLGKEYSFMLKHIKFSMLPFMEEIALTHYSQEYEMKAQRIANHIYEYYGRIIRKYNDMLLIIETTI